MKPRKAVRSAILLLALLSFSGCIQYAYYVEQETANDVAGVRGASQIWARELVVSFTPPDDWEYPEDRWAVVESELKSWYAAWIVSRVQKSGAMVSVVSWDEELKDGVILETNLTKMEKGSHGWTGLGAGMTKREKGWATVTFRDAQSGEQLYASEITMESGVGSADGGFGFKDRVKFLMWHCANSVLDLMQNGALGIGPRTQKGKG
jgi:hypothetical protein